MFKNLIALYLVIIEKMALLSREQKQQLEALGRQALVVICGEKLASTIVTMQPKDFASIPDVSSALSPEGVKLCGTLSGVADALTLLAPGVIANSKSWQKSLEVTSMEQAAAPESKVEALVSPSAAMIMFM